LINSDLQFHLARFAFLGIIIMDKGLLVGLNLQPIVPCGNIIDCHLSFAGSRYNVVAVP